MADDPKPELTVAHYQIEVLAVTLYESYARVNQQAGRCPPYHELQEDRRIFWRKEAVKMARELAAL